MKASFDIDCVVRFVSLGAASCSVLVLAACGGGDPNGSAIQGGSVAAEAARVAVSDEADSDDRAIRTVPRANCGPEDNPETALQGQVPAALRASGELPPVRQWIQRKRPEPPVRPSLAA